MTARDRLLLKIIVPVVVVSAFWFLALSPKLSDMRTAGDDVASARSELIAATGKLAEQKANRAQLSARQASLAGAARAVPASKATPALLRELQRTAEHSGVSLDAVTPAGSSGPGASTTTAATPGVDTTSLSLTFTGKYANTQRFLTMLGNLVKVSRQRVSATGRLISISSVQLAPGSKGSGLSATMTASVYALQSATELAAASAATSPATGGTSTTTTPGNSSSAPVTSAAATGAQP
jgi:Tfp pilus assembly protein PilO